MRIKYLALAWLAAACALAAPASAVIYPIGFRFVGSDIRGTFYFAHSGTNVAAASAVSYLGSTNATADHYGDLVADWTVTANRFTVGSLGQISAAHFDAVSADGTEWLKINIAGENSATGHYPDDEGGASYTFSNTDGFSGVSFFFNSSGSILPGPGVPEPSTWATLVVGFFAIGALRYRAVARSRARPE
jgi:hypothetical protein